MSNSAHGELRMRVRLRKLPAHEASRPHGVMGLNFEGGVIEFFRQDQQPRAEPPSGLGLTATGAGSLRRRTRMRSPP